MYKSATFATLFSVIKFNINTIILQDMELDTFAQKLRYLRLERNLNQHEFANLLNKSFTSVCNWEKGVRIPKLETIKEIAEILNVDYTFLKDQ
ncbi:helix-turn-helix domain-containing protein [Paraclostridium bifermentans]|uniref:helix-turn-helix domain-containing protein n=1 Tax=Paraclostridium bifermentans TaxID=1490 RepID=UPI00189FC75F|nr:helix-turn-helix transcriptional regulator [Paraclostridium bifermentans]